jgi:hypothetical protein
MVVRAVRADRILAACDMYVSVVFGDSFQWRAKLDLREVRAAFQKITYR